MIFVAFFVLLLYLTLRTDGWVVIDRDGGIPFLGRIIVDYTSSKPSITLRSSGVSLWNISSDLSGPYIYSPGELNFFNAGGDHFTARLAVDGDDHAHTASIMLLRRIVGVRRRQLQGVGAVIGDELLATLGADVVVIGHVRSQRLYF